MYFQLQLWLAFPHNMIIAYCCVCVCRHPCRWNACWTKASVKGQITQLLILQLRDLKNGAAVSVHLGKLSFIWVPGTQLWVGQRNQQQHRMTENITVEMKIDHSGCDGKQMRYPAGTPRWRNTDIWTIKTGTGSPGDCQSHISLLLSLQRTGVHTR